MALTNGFSEGTKIIAYDFETRKKVGEYNSMMSACRKLFIRRHNSIFSYLFGDCSKGSTSTMKGNKRGVADYKTGKKYHFELVK